MDIVETLCKRLSARGTEASDQGKSLFVNPDDILVLTDEITDLRARCASLEADRDEWKLQCFIQNQRANVAEERITELRKEAK